MSSSGLSYLHNLRKSDLTEFAETTNLPDYASLKKAELEEKLDAHLQKNATTYSKEPTLNAYYSRMGTIARSPIKRIAEKVSDIVKSDDDAPPATTAKKARRKTRSPEDETTDTDGAAAALVKTPGKELSRRTSILAASVPLPPSPAVVTDAIDRQARQIRSSISHAYERTQIQAYSDSARELLSSTVTVNVLAILIEAVGLKVVPFKPITEIAPISHVTSEATKIYAPDVFALLTQPYWARISLWLLITIITPAVLAYFVNLPLKQLPSHGSARRATLKSNPHTQFDPFVFNIAKGLVTYLILGLHYHPLGLYDHVTLAEVNAGLPGGYYGVLISSGIGAAVSLYEAVLKR